MNAITTPRAVVGNNFASNESGGEKAEASR